MVADQTSPSILCNKNSSETIPMCDVDSALNTSPKPNLNVVSQITPDSFHTSPTKKSRNKLKVTWRHGLVRRSGRRRNNGSLSNSPETPHVLESDDPEMSESPVSVSKKRDATVEDAQKSKKRMKHNMDKPVVIELSDSVPKKKHVQNSKKRKKHNMDKAHVIELSDSASKKKDAMKRKGKTPIVSPDVNDDDFSTDITLTDFIKQRSSSKKVPPNNHSLKQSMAVAPEKVITSDPTAAQDDPKFRSLRTRSSPIQFSKCVRLLRPKQKEVVRKMGFGQLLTFMCDGVPLKLGHFVVDNFNPKRMVIQVGDHSVRVNPKAIHKLLGVPFGGRKLKDGNPLRSRDPKVVEWRNRYPRKNVPPTKIVKNITNAPDEDSFFFRMDFVMCFLSVLVECRAQGRLKEKILNYITSDIDWNGIDWCHYITKSMKGCKDNWKRDTWDSNFAGPLAILTLLYVDSFTCEGIEPDPSKNAISFWTMDKLKCRENWETKHGGFGKGKFKTLSKAVDDGSEKLSGFDISYLVAEVENDIMNLANVKSNLDHSFYQLKNNSPQSPQLKLLQDKYMEIISSGPIYSPPPLNSHVIGADSNPQHDPVADEQANHSAHELEQSHSSNRSKNSVSDEEGSEPSDVEDSNSKNDHEDTGVDENVGDSPDQHTRSFKGPDDQHHEAYSGAPTDSSSDDEAETYAKFCAGDSLYDHSNKYDKVSLVSDEPHHIITSVLDELLESLKAQPSPENIPSPQKAPGSKLFPVSSTPKASTPDVDNNMPESPIAAVPITAVPMIEKVTEVAAIMDSKRINPARHTSVSDVSMSTCLHSAVQLGAPFSMEETKILNLLFNPQQNTMYL
ncbi:hypothetical protein SSX86_030157 [Deinandra increscens subsp. villosa]|uniref:Uncharacterized protein n=1 Tax=Deinandra increscens subsp. villosa TaxID=3103831 RepID=A0AAP0C6Y1_9ASTR